MASKSKWTVHFLLNIEIKIDDIVVMPIDCEVNIHKQFKGQNQSV